MLNTYKISIVFILFLFLSACAKENTFDPHLKNKQNAFAYLNEKTKNNPILSLQQQQLAFANFLQHYYSPWTDQDRLFTNQQIKVFFDEQIVDLNKNPGWNFNRHPHTQQWSNELISNMNMGQFPNHLQNAIITHSADERAFPTNTTSYSSVTDPAHFYPFDNFQNAFLVAGMPVKILQESKNKAWALIINNASIGWVAADNLAPVDDNFIKAWNNNQGHIAFKADGIAIIDVNGVFRSVSSMGGIYPIAEETKTDFIINIPVKNINGMAVIEKAIVNKNAAVKIPVPTTPQNIATVANQFIGMPYGWGGIYGYRDCSATTKAILSYFGIWLPRTSTQQAVANGRLIDVSALTNAEKLQILRQQGVPFFTIIHLPGHIMLYLGDVGNKLYVLHDMWGLKTYGVFQSGRAVIGSTVITPIDFGADYLNVTHSLLDRVIGITILNEAPDSAKINSIDNKNIIPD